MDFYVYAFESSILWACFDFFIRGAKIGNCSRMVGFLIESKEVQLFFEKGKCN